MCFEYDLLKKNNDLLKEKVELLKRILEIEVENKQIIYPFPWRIGTGEPFFKFEQTQC